MLGTRWYKF